MGIGLADDIALDLHVHHDEVSTIERVRHNTAYKCSCQYHCVRLFFIEELLDGYLIGQVQLLVAAANKVIITPTLQIIPYR